MGHQNHRHDAPPSVKVAILTVSTTRDHATDKSGRWIAECAVKENHQVIAHEVTTDQIDAIRQSLMHILSKLSPDAIIITGGTGVTPMDVTPEAVRPLFVKELTAFGTLFTQLSYDDIGTAALLSRAMAGVIEHTVIFCLPGSLNACQLACNKLIFPEIGHMVSHAAGR